MKNPSGPVGNCPSLCEHWVIQGSFYRVVLFITCAKVLTLLEVLLFQSKFNALSLFHNRFWSWIMDFLIILESNIFISFGSTEKILFLFHPTVDVSKLRPQFWRCASQKTRSRISKADFWTKNQVFMKHYGQSDFLLFSCFNQNNQ